MTLRKALASVRNRLGEEAQRAQDANEPPYHQLMHL